MRFIRLLGLAFFATLVLSAVGALGAGSASAFHPLFLLLKGTELSFTVSGRDPTLRGENLGATGTILCNKVEGSGAILAKSTLAHRVHLRFFEKCEQTVGTNKATCKEPILPKLALAELGLLLLPGGHASDVALRLAPDDGTTVFTTVECLNGNTTVEGEIVGEVIGPFNTEVASAEVRFESVGKNSATQLYKSIDLLGVEDTNQHLSVAGAFGGEAAEDAKVTITFDGNNAEICTKEPQNCP